MRVVLDSNILFSALIKDSFVRSLILQYDGFFLFPSLILDELKKHKMELLKKSGLNDPDFVELLDLLLSKVVVVHEQALQPYRKKAWELVKDIDPDDVLFVACALAFPDSIIWSDDKKLKLQLKVKVLSTQEIAALL